MTVKYIKQFAIIMLVTFLGEILSKIIPLPIPASIWGLVLMLVSLTLKIIPLDAVKETAKFLVSLMQIMFIPAAVGLITELDSLKNALIPILISIVVITPIVFFVSGKVTDTVIKIQKSKEKDEKNV